jgi:hypothetical protein
MTPESLSRTLQEFLGGWRHAVVLEDGARIFDLADSKYSVSGEYNKCLLHLWSAERNAVRRILDTEVRNGTLRLMVQKLGHARPSNWRSAAAWTIARPRRDARPDPRTNSSYDERWSATFPDSPSRS